MQACVVCGASGPGGFLGKVAWRGALVVCPGLVLALVSEVRPLGQSLCRAWESRQMSGTAVAP